MGLKVLVSTVSGGGKLDFPFLVSLRGSRDGDIWFVSET